MRSSTVLPEPRTGLAVAWLAPLFAGASVLLTWPLAARLRGALPGAGADLAGSALRWHATRSAGGRVSELVQEPSLQQPFGWDLLVREGLPLDALAGLPLLQTLGWPAGPGLFVLSALSLAGLSAAWLGTLLTGSLWAGLAAGAAWQASTALQLHAAEGRWDALLALALLPLTAGLGVQAAARGARSWAALAGLLAAAVVLLWTPGLVVLGVGGLLLGGLLLARPGGLLDLWRVGSAGALAAAAALLVPLGWLRTSRWLLPGSRGEAVSTELGLVEHLQVAVEGSLLGSAGPAWAPSVGLGIAALAGLVLSRGRRGAWTLPLGLSLVLGLMALGPALGPVPGPGWLLLALPGPWWPPAELVAGVELGLVVLVALGLARLPAAARPLVGLLLGLGFVLEVPSAREGPFPTTPWPRHGGGFLEVSGPVVWVPAPGGPEDPEQQVLLDVVRFDLHLVDPAVPPALSWSADPVSEAQARRYGPLGTLARIGEETEPEGLSVEALGLLADAGAAVLVVDHAALEAAGTRGERAAERLEAVLGPRVLGQRFQVVELSGR